LALKEESLRRQSNRQHKQQKVDEWSGPEDAGLAVVRLRLAAVVVIIDVEY
jgi:hypothetical protein